MTTNTPSGATTKDGKVYNYAGLLIELYEGEWRIIKNCDRSGWWRYHDRYDRNGYCDNPGRGY